MKDSIKYSKNRAAEALKALLEQMSAVKLKDVKFDSLGSACKTDIFAQIEVYGHSYTLACKLITDNEPGHVCTALNELRNHIGQFASNATPVFIAPYLPDEVRELCRKSDAGFLDLEGNAHLVFDEVFIIKRSLPRHKPHRSSTSRRELPVRASRKESLRSVPESSLQSSTSQSAAADFEELPSRSFGFTHVHSVVHPGGA